MINVQGLVSKPACFFSPISVAQAHEGSIFENDAKCFLSTCKIWKPLHIWWFDLLFWLQIPSPNRQHFGFITQQVFCPVPACLYDWLYNLSTRTQMLQNFRKKQGIPHDSHIYTNPEMIVAHPMHNATVEQTPLAQSLYRHVAAMVHFELSQWVPNGSKASCAGSLP